MRRFRAVFRISMRQYLQYRAAALAVQITSVPLDETVAYLYREMAEVRA